MRSDKMGSPGTELHTLRVLKQKKIFLKQGTFQQEGLILEEEWNRDIYASCESKRRFL